MPDPVGGTEPLLGIPTRDQRTERLRRLGSAVLRDEGGEFLLAGAREENTAGQSLHLDSEAEPCPCLADRLGDVAIFGIAVAGRVQHQLETVAPARLAQQLLRLIQIERIGLQLLAGAVEAR